VANELALSLRFAKTEAITLNTPISLCAASSSAKSNCNEQADWQYGWIIFRDPTQTGQLANLDDRIKVSAELPKGVTISSSITHLTFENQGFLSSNSGDLIISATGCSGEHRYTLSLSALGRVDSSKSTC
jgi:Tfp pilus assembly protein FimT